MGKVIKIRGKRNHGFNEANVELTKHFVTRNVERRQELQRKSEENVRARLLHEVRSSKLISVRGNEEHRSFNCHIFICKREHGKLVAVTYVVSKTHKTINEFSTNRKVS